MVPRNFDLHLCLLVTSSPRPAKGGFFYLPQGLCYNPGMTQKRMNIVAIHGAGMTAGVWGGLVPHLLDHSFRALTLPGHDAKSGGTLLPDIAGMAKWLREKLESEGQKDVLLVGHSMGALVALAAADAPCVSGVALMGAALAMPVNPDLLKIARENPAEAIGMVIKWGVYSGHPQVGAVRTVLGSVMHGADPSSVANDLAACDAFNDGETLAKSLKKPVLVLAGEQDKMTKATDGEALSKAVEGSEFRLLKDCGHMMMVERPIDVAREIKDFISARISQENQGVGR